MLKLKTLPKIPGTILFSRYAFAPNKLQFCGPKEWKTIFEYTRDNVSDPDLVGLLSEFEGAYPYLQFIAQENKITDPFNYRVVEAYWLGNELLFKTELSKFYEHLKKRFRGRMMPSVFRNLSEKIPLGAKPYHAFHVFDIYTRIGGIRGIDLGPVLETIDNCRIGWGKVVNDKDKILVEYQKIVMRNNRLILGPKIIRDFEYKFGDYNLISKPQIGDWVSVHWGWVCDKLNPKQLKNLQKWTLWHLKLANFST